MLQTPLLAAIEFYSGWYSDPYSNPFVGQLVRDAEALIESLTIPLEDYQTLVEVMEMGDFAQRAMAIGASEDDRGYFLPIQFWYLWNDTQERSNILDITNRNEYGVLDYRLLLDQAEPGVAGAFAVRIPDTGQIYYFKNEGDAEVPYNVLGGTGQACWDAMDLAHPGVIVYPDPPLTFRDGETYDAVKLLAAVKMDFAENLPYQIRDYAMADTFEELSAYKSFVREKGGNWLDFLGAEEFITRLGDVLQAREKWVVSRWLDRLERESALSGIAAPLYNIFSAPVKDVSC